MLEPPISDAGWSRVRFDQMAKQINDRVDNPAEAGVERYVGLEHLDPDSLNIRRWGEPTDVEAMKLRFQPGDIIFGRRRVYQRKVAVADFEGICSAHAMVLRPQSGPVIPEFVPFFMQSDLFMARALSISVGSLSPTINWKTLAEEKFLIPPRQQQARIVEASLAASSARSANWDLYYKAQSLADAISEALFEQVLTDSKSSIATIGSIFQQIIDRGHAELPILSVTIGGRVVRREDLDRHVSDDSGDEKYLRVMPGDLAYNTMRLWQGAVGIVQEEGLISPAYTVMRRHNKDLDIEFFCELLRSSVMKREYRKLVTGVASDRWRLYFKDLAKISVNISEIARNVGLWSALKQAREKQANIQKRLEGIDLVAKQIINTASQQ